MAGYASNSWYRTYHGTVGDDKWPLIAKRSGQNVAAVVAVWHALLECASQAQERGCVRSFDCESMDVLLGLDEGSCESILKAMSSGRSPRIKDGRIVNWEKRQPKRERDDPGATQRSRNFRDRKKLQQEAEIESIKYVSQDGVSPEITPCNEAEHHETPENAMQRDETPCNAHIRERDRETDRKKEKEREKREPLTCQAPSLPLPSSQTYLPRPKDENEVADLFRAEVAACRLRLRESDIPEAASKFFNDKEAVGWSSNNGAPIVNWKAAAKSWALRYAGNLEAKTKAEDQPTDTYAGMKRILG